MKIRILSSLALSTTFVIGGCINTPQYSLIEDGDKVQTADVFDHVSYRIYPEPNFQTPECVAVLPLEVAPEASKPISLDYLANVDTRNTGNETPALDLPRTVVTDKSEKKTTPHAYQLRFDVADKQRLVRNMLYGFVSAHAPKDVEFSQIDQVTRGKPVRDIKMLKAVAQHVDCDWLLIGRITHFNVDFLGVYSNIRIGADLELIRASSGKRIWNGRHVAQGHSGSVPITLVDLAISAVKAVSNLEPDQLEGVAADLARRLVRTMPLETNNPFLLASTTSTHMTSDIDQNLGRLYRVVVENLNLREGPSTRYKVRKVLHGSEKVSFINHAGHSGWCRVRTHDGQVGYVAVRYLKPMSPTGKGG